MKGFVRLFLILAVFVISTTTNSQATVIDKIKAVVNNEVITQSEIDRRLYPLYNQYKNIYSGKELEKKLDDAGVGILNQLIEDRLILSEGKNQGIEATEKEIEHKIDEFKKSFDGEENMLKKLSEQNLTIKDIENMFKDRVIIEKIIDREVRTQIIILPQEIESYYEENTDKFKEPLQVKASTILIRTGSNRTQEETLSLTITLLNRLKTGQDFYTLAKNYSEGMNAEKGGDMGYVRKGQMIEQIDKVIFNLKVGEFSDLVKTSLGYHIFKVYDKKKERTLPLVEIRPQIMEAIYLKKTEVYFKKWLKDLRENAFISIK